MEGPLLRGPMLFTGRASIVELFFELAIATLVSAGLVHFVPAVWPLRHQVGWVDWISGVALLTLCTGIALYYSFLAFITAGQLWENWTGGQFAEKE